MISKYEFIDAQKAFFPTTLMCVWSAVSRSGFGGFWRWSQHGSLSSGLLAGVSVMGGALPLPLDTWRTGTAAATAD